jgi:hypothetical protein
MSNPLAMVESGYKSEEERGTWDMFREESFRGKVQRERVVSVICSLTSHVLDVAM